MSLPKFVFDVNVEVAKLSGTAANPANSANPVAEISSFSNFSRVSSQKKGQMGFNGSIFDTRPEVSNLCEPSANSASDDVNEIKPIFPELSAEDKAKVDAIIEEVERTVPKTWTAEAVKQFEDTFTSSPVIYKPIIRVVDYSGPKPNEIPFSDFCRRTMRDILGANSDLLIEFSAALGPILAATGHNALQLAKKQQPDRVIPFHEIINFLLPHWNSSMLDKQLIDIIPISLSQERVDEIIQDAKRILGAEVVS